MKVLEEMLRQAVDQGVFPGYHALVWYRGEVVLEAKGGYAQKVPHEEPIPERPIFDLASLTKPFATATLVLKWVHKGKLDLQAPASAYLPEAGPYTLLHLLTHTAGLPDHVPLYRETANPREARKRVLSYRGALGTQTLYSDLGYMILGWILEEVGRAPLDRLFQEETACPLGLRETCFRPGPELRDRCMATELDPETGLPLRGVVHDENARFFGGVAGHAGLFSTAHDLLVFARFVLREGFPEYFRRYPELGAPNRTAGWVAAHEGWFGGAFTTPRAIGHTGFTGTSLLIDPDPGLIVILLTNRVHPTRENRRILEFRPAFHEAVYRSLGLLPA